MAKTHDNCDLCWIDGKGERHCNLYGRRIEKNDNSYCDGWQNVSRELYDRESRRH